jgi:hypothetical protein
VSFSPSAVFIPISYGHAVRRPSRSTLTTRWSSTPSIASMSRALCTTMVCSSTRPLGWMAPWVSANGEIFRHLLLGYTYASPVASLLGLRSTMLFRSIRLANTARSGRTRTLVANMRMVFAPRSTSTCVMTASHTARTTTKSSQVRPLT